MEIRMLETRLGVANAVGSRTLLYRGGRRYRMSAPWQKALAAVFLEAGWAEALEPQGDGGRRSRARRARPR